MECVFADAKEKHGMRYTQYRGLAQVTIKFSAMNLKKLATWKWKNPSPGKEKDFYGRLFFLAAVFPFSNEKACLGVIAKTDFFYRLSRPQNLQAAAFCVPRVAPGHGIIFPEECGSAHARQGSAAFAARKTARWLLWAPPRCGQSQTLHRPRWRGAP